ncbi:hypothetical protein NMG60_11006220 [Bertholletia excelsa]
MFPSTNSANNTFPQFSPQLQLSPPPFFDVPDIFLHHYPDLLATGDFFPSTDAVCGMAVPKQAITTNPEDQIAIPRKKSKKKDRHSKIYTAQGPRDRRVRLSIEIARKFFDLQDTLGFDKASRTLDWLLTNSKNAIKELKQAKQKSISPSATKCDEVLSQPKEKGSGRREDIVAKELRAKARARARERAKEKICTRSVSQSPELPIFNGVDAENSVNGQTCGYKLGQPMRSEESHVMKRKVKQVSILSDQQSMSSVNTWDLDGTFVRPSVYAMIDTNLLPEPQFCICNEPSEVWDNHS